MKWHFPKGQVSIYDQPMSQYDLTVLIPCLNESESLPDLLEDLNAQRGIALQVLVCDGGSTDGSQALAREKGATVIEASRGRAKQMNLGFQSAQSENCFFLHADSRLKNPDLLRKALSSLEKKIQAAPNTVVAGHFGLKFIQETDDNNWAFRWLEEKTRTNRLHSINGDQGLLITRTDFQKLGQYDESMNFLEDQKIAAKIFDEGEWVLLPGELWTSGRRFETEGFHRRYILMSLIMGLYWTGTHEFFVRARDVYKNQDDTSELMLAPFAKAIWDMHRFDLGFWGSIKTWFKVGHYVRTNSWQLFFFFDVAFRNLLGEGRYPFTWFHDKIFWPITNNRLCDAINTFLTVVWFMGVLGPYFVVTEAFQGTAKLQKQ